MSAGATWNSLEAVKLAVAALTPVLVVIAGFWLNRRLKSLEHAQWARQKVVERRIRAYDELAPQLNKLFCFFCYIGTWKELTPPHVISLKRELDATAHISAPLFDPEFLQRYNKLMEVCFSTFGNWGEDAKLRTLPDRRIQVSADAWDPTWDRCFVAPDEAPEPSEVKDAYAELMRYLAWAIGAKEVSAHLLGTTQLPGNFRDTPVGTVSRIQPDDA